MQSFHNSKDEINKGYDVVPQLNDNVRLTIDEYRNKLYQFIQNKPFTRLSQSAQQAPAPQPKQQPHNNTASAPSNHHNHQKSENSNSNVHQSELIDHYAQQKNNYASSYNNQYESKSANDLNDQSDDNSLTPTPPSPPQQQLNETSQSAANNHNRKKHASDFQNYNNSPINNSTANANANAISNLIGGGAVYSGLFSAF